MMLKVILILLLLGSCAVVEKPVQVKVIYLTVIKVEGEWITWADADGLEFFMQGSNYKVGQRLPFLVTK